MTASRDSLNKITAIIFQNGSTASAALICFAGLGFYFYGEKVKRFFNPTKSLAPQKPQTNEASTEATKEIPEGWVDVDSPKENTRDSGEWPADAAKNNLGIH